jgi:defect-in-organelle-trafficking protein DotB
MITIPEFLLSRADLDTILINAHENGVSDVHIGGEDKIKVRRHGEIEDFSERVLNLTEVQNLLIASYDDNQSAVNKVNSGDELDYSYVCQHPYEREYLRWRVNAGGRRKLSERDIKLVFRTIPSQPPTVESLEIEKDIVELTTSIEKGLVIVTGATGSGKSTLLASLLRKRLELNSEHMITAEAPIEYVYDSIETTSCVTAQEIGRGGDHKTFCDALVAALRKDPDVILVGEARDKQTVEAALHGVQTGHVLFTTCHTNGVANTINRILKVFPESDREAVQMDIIDNLSLLVYQTLVPTVDGKRTALREYLIFDGKIKDRLRECDSIHLFSECTKVLSEQGNTLLRHAEKKHSAGIISDITLRRIQKESEANLVEKYEKNEKSGVNEINGRNVIEEISLL